MSETGKSTAPSGLTDEHRLHDSQNQPLHTAQWLSFAALIVVAAAGWLFLVKTEVAMRVMRGDGFFMELMWYMMDPHQIKSYLAATVVMWVVMMVAMMVPAVMPMMAVFAKLDRGKDSAYDPLLFACGYLLAWSAFALVAAVLQWFAHRNGALQGTLLATHAFIAAALLIAAGFYQLTPWKTACLEKCRSPLGFFLANWRAGRVGALQMGWQHGYVCIACCWMLMLLMFVGGAMSVFTMLLLCVFILAERTLPAGPWTARLPGVGMIVWGIYLALTA